MRRGDSAVLWAVVAAGVAAGATALFLGPGAIGPHAVAFHLAALVAACLASAGLAAALVARPVAGLGACLAALAATATVPGGPAALWKDAAAALGAARTGHVAGTVALVVLAGAAVGWWAGLASRGGRRLLALVLPLAAVILWWSLGGRGTAAAVCVLVPAWWLIVRPGGDTRAAGPALVLLPAVGLAALLPTGYVPATADRMDAWARARIPWVDAIEGENAFDSDGFGTRAAGFIYSQVEALGGSFVPDSREVMIVTVRGPASGPRVLYLRGAVRDGYDSHAWTLARNGQPAEVRPGSGVLGVTLSLDVRDLATGERVLFAPGYLISSLVSPAMDSVIVPGSVWTALGPDASGPKRYRETAFIPYPWPGGPSGPGAGAVPPSVSPLEGARATPPFQGRAGPRLQEDLALPDSVPQRVLDLARSITRGRTGTVAKAEALEAYLQQFTYDTDPPPAPGRRDFVDHFLFTAKRGYCTSFASALVVMLRASGVPARYVEGYRVPLAGSPTTVEGQRVVVRKSQAHAWVEAFDPAGPAWLTFDPTPPTAIAGSTGVPVAGSGRSSSNPASQDPDPRKFQPNRSAGSEALPSEGPAGGTVAGGAAGSNAGGSASRWFAGARQDPALAGLELAVAMMWLALVTFGARLIWLRMRRLGEAARSWDTGWFMVARLAWAGLEAAGMRPEPGHTALAFLRRAGDRYPEASGPLARLASAYDAIRYGPREQAEAGQSAGKAMDTWRVLRRALGKRAGRVRIWMIEAELARRTGGGG